MPQDFVKAKAAKKENTETDEEARPQHFVGRNPIRQDNPYIDEEPRGVPKNGGEKNFVEFCFPDSGPAVGPDAGLRLPHTRTTCE